MYIYMCVNVLHTYIMYMYMYIYIYHIWLDKNNLHQTQS